MDTDAMKRAVAEAAVAYVRQGSVIGVGAGTTTELFIRVLAESDNRPRAAVAASERSATLLESAGVTVVMLAEELVPLELYVDGADEADDQLRLIKGGGGALTREKVLASAAQRFVCIVDETKLVFELGAFPLPVEVVPAALGFVAHEMRRLGGVPTLRQGFATDNGNVVLDVTGLDLSDPEAAEFGLDAIPGVVECGVFARRRADVLLVGTPGGVRRLGETVE